MNIYYLGPEGSFSEIVVKKVFGKSGKFTALSSFEEIVEKTEKDTKGIGALVIENSISSSVHAAVDMMYASKLNIVGEAFLKIKLDLIGLSGVKQEKITDVYSHPQALVQSSQFINKNIIIAHELKSTSAAAEFIKKSNDKSKAAIGSNFLAKKYGLNIIASDIANSKHNLSRWIFISQKSVVSDTVADKVTYIFKVKHVPGSLVKVLKKIAEAQGNLTKIESRPLPGTNWEYGFWVDLEIPVGSKKHFDEIMKKETLYFRVVGSYRRGNIL